MTARTGDPAKQAGVLVLGTTLATLSSALLPLLVVRLLGKADVAQLLALILVYETVALILTAGFPQTLMYHLPGNELAQRRAVALRVNGLLAGLGSLAALVLVAIALVGDHLPAIFSHQHEVGVSLQPLVLLAPALIAELPLRALPNLLVAEQRARWASGLGVVRALVTTLAQLVPLALGYGVWTVVACYALARLALGLAVPWALAAIYRGAERVRSQISVRELFRFAIPLGATDVVSLFNAQLDRWLILFAFPAVGFADYQAGAWQVPVIGDIAYSVGTAYMPELTERFKAGQPREALALWRRSILKVSLIVLPVTMGFAVAAEELMVLLFTPSYLGGAPIFRLYSLLTLGRVAAFGSVIVAAGAPRFVLQASVLSLVSNVLFCVPLLLTIGFTGPALGTVLAFVPTVVFYVWSIGRASKVPALEVFPLGGYLRVLGLTTVAAVAGIAVKLTLQLSNGAMLFAEVGAVVATFALLGTVTRTIERSDWRFLLDWLRLRVAR